MKSGGIALALALLSCGGKHTANCQGSFRPAGLTDQEADEVRAAMAYLDGWAGTHTTLSDDGLCEVVPTTLPADMRARGVVASYRYGSGQLWIDREVMKAHDCDVAWQCYRTVFTHELGHSYGLGHIPDHELGIMSASFNAWTFTDADREECRRAGVCAN